jgi:hypothetical protein
MIIESPAVVNPLLKVSWGHISHAPWEGNCPYPSLMKVSVSQLLSKRMTPVGMNAYLAFSPLWFIIFPNF